MTTLQPLQSAAPPPPPDLQLQLIVDGDDDFDGHPGSGSRRPSTASLSRFRSCPQLASAANTSQDSPGSDMAPITDTDGNIIHTAPQLRNSLYVDLPKPEPGGVRSAAGTPTPPSTPGSRRKDLMSSSATSKSQPQSNGASPSSTPKQSRRFRTEQGFGNRTHSADSQGGTLDGGFSLGGLPLKEENLQKLDEIYARERNLPFEDMPDLGLDDDRVSETDEGSSMHVSGRFAHRNRHYYHPSPEDDSVDKCSRWLQSLKLNKADKIKSRSHIQLPPI